MTIKVEDGHVVVTRPNDLKKMKSLHGLTRTLISNMVTGVHTGYEKVLEVNGVGYRCSKSGKNLTLHLGYSHPVEMTDPEGLEAVVDGNKITVKGIDKEKVGQYAAEILSLIHILDTAVASILSPAAKMSALISCAGAYSAAFSNLNSLTNFL